MFKIKNGKIEKEEDVTFASQKLKECNVEELIRNNIDLLFDEETLLVIGQQVANEERGRSDLTAIDDSGNLVLIEVKRDKKDMKSRKEALEFQAIRYAAAYATIKDEDELINKVYAPYIEKHRQEFQYTERTATEIAVIMINDFKKEQAAWQFNKKQRIILVASDFDPQTLTAAAWLAKNNVDLTCFKLIPYIINKELFIDVKKIIPLDTYDDIMISVKGSNVSSQRNKLNSAIVRESLPRIADMLEWGVVKAGDIIVAKGREDEATLLANGMVKVAANGKELSMQNWLKKLYGWSSIQSYVYAVHKATNKTLSEIREEYLEETEKNATAELLEDNIQ